MDSERIERLSSETETILVVGRPTIERAGAQIASC
jgi:hypothetical protein